MKIDIHNYEEFMLNFVDNELNAEEIKALALFLEQHPELQHGLKLLQATKLPIGEKIIFLDKNFLYRKEEFHAPKIYFLRRHPWLSIASAACLLLFVALLLHPWKKQRSFQQTAYHALPAQTSKSPLSTSVDSALKPVAPKRQKEMVAINQPGKKNIVHSLSGTKESNALAEAQPIEEPKPALPATLPDIRSSANEKDNIALHGNKLPQRLPLESITNSMEEKKINIHTESISQNNETLVAANKIGGSEDFAQKVDDWRKKPSEILENIHQNGIKIGKITFAFNN